MHQAPSLRVHHATMATVALVHPEGGPDVLCPTLVAWVDLHPLRARGLVFGPRGAVLPSLQVSAATLEDDRAYIRLTVSTRATAPSPPPTRGGPGDHSEPPHGPSDLGPMPHDLVVPDDLSGLLDLLDPAPVEAALDDPAAASPGASNPDTGPGPVQATLVLPTTSVALVLALSSVPAMVNLVLVDGPPPSPVTAAFTTLRLGDLAAVLLMDPDVMHDALCGAVAPALHTPLPVPVPVTDEDTVAEQADLWSMISGVALGQDHALQALIAHAQHLAEDEAAVRAAAAMHLLSLAHEQGAAAVEALGHRVDLSPLPPAISGLSRRVTEDVPLMALALLAEGAALPAVADQHGLAPAVVAAATLTAIRAASLTALSDVPPATWLVADWLTHPDDRGDTSTSGTGASDDEAATARAYWAGHGQPWWAMPATASLLLGHDIAVTSDLLSTVDVSGSRAPSGTAGMPVLQRWVHVLADAVAALDLPTPHLTVALAQRPVRPVNHADVLDLAVALRDAGPCSHDLPGVVVDPAPGGDPDAEPASAAGPAPADHVGDQPDGGYRGTGTDEHCPSRATDALRHRGWSTLRLARAAAALLPALADVDAVESGYTSREPQWSTHRRAFLTHWLTATAWSPTSP